MVSLNKKIKALNKFKLRSSFFYVSMFICLSLSNNVREKRPRTGNWTLTRSKTRGKSPTDITEQTPSMHCSSRNRKTGRGGGGNAPNSQTAKREKRLNDNKRRRVSGRDWQQVAQGGGVRRGEGGVPPHNPHLKTPTLRGKDGGMETGPYSRSSSSYNSLYLPLLNLKEKNGTENKKLPFLNGNMSRKKEREKEGKNIKNVWAEGEKQHGRRMRRRKEGGRRTGWESLESGTY